MCRNDLIKKCEKVSRGMLRIMNVGEEQTIELPDVKGIESCKSTASQMKTRHEGVFKVEPDWKKNIVKITRLV